MSLLSMLIKRHQSLLQHVTMSAKGEKHISRAGASDKRAITVTLGETLEGHNLPFQLIYTGKTQRFFPSVKFPEGFFLAYNPKHWSNEKLCD